MLRIEAVPLERNDLYRKAPKEEDATKLISESFELFVHGQRRAVYLTGQPLEELRKHVLQVEKMHVARRQSGVASRSRVFGYSPRMPLQSRDYCTKSSLIREYPEAAHFLQHQAEVFTEVYKRVFPDEFQNSELAIQNIKPEWRMGNSVFTSGIINLDNPLVYHYDAGNFERTQSVMAVFKKNVTGGHLVLPEYNIKIQCADSSLFIFDGQSELHGVTPIIATQEDSYRYSVVFYCLEAMCKCGTPKEELRRAQVSRTQVEMKRAGLQKAKK